MTPMDKRVRFLKWFRKHPRLYADIFTISGLASIYTLFFDVLHGNFLKLFLLLLWFFIFAALGHVSMEICLCIAADRLEAENK